MAPPELLTITQPNKTYLCPVTLEQDEDTWRAFVPPLESQGAATWGHTPDEALANLREVVALVLESILERKESLPNDIRIFSEPVLAVRV